MKKVLSLFLALVMLMSLAACASNAEEAKTEAPATATEETKTDDVANEESAPESETAPTTSDDKDLKVYGIYKMDATYFRNEAWALEQAMKEVAEPAGYTVSWQYVSCDMDPEKCMTLIENAIADKADAIVMCVPDQTMSVAIVDRCEEAGVPIVAVDDGLIDADGNKIAPWFGIDAYNIGYSAGKWMANYAKDNNLLDDPSVGLMYSTISTVSSIVPRTEGEQAAWADVVGDALSDRTFISDFESSMEASFASSSAVIAGNPQITKWLVMSVSEVSALGVASALEEAGLDEESCVIALGCDDTSLQWDEGNFKVVRESAYFSGMLVGREAGLALADFLINGTEMPDEYATPAIMVDQTNYKEHIIRKEG